MSDFFLELYSEEIPASLQKDARDGILKLFKEIFEKNEFIYKFAESYSTPNRLVFYISGIPRVISKKAYKIKGPRVDSSKQAIEGFARSNQIEVKNLIQENNDKGNFYFAKIESKKIFIQEELANIIPEVLKKFPWKKSMKWGNYEISWARPLRSILALFDNNTLKFQFYHIKSSNITFLNSQLQENKKKN